MLLNALKLYKKMDVFIKVVCLVIFLVGQVLCGVDRISLTQQDTDGGEIQVSSGDRTDVKGDTELLFAGSSDDSEDLDDLETGNVSRVISTLKVTNGGRWGDWGLEQFCPDGSYAVGYDMKIKPRVRSDNTALNAIKLICEFPDGKVTGEVTSTKGQWGFWVGQTKCPSRVRERLYLTSFDLQVQKYRGTSRDDTAANYVKFTCRDICGTQTSSELVKPPGHGVWGTWGAWSSKCPLHTAICGIKTRVEKPQGSFKDDTALNDVKFYCCV